jgi:cation:H+ antiporter
MDLVVAIVGLAILLGAGDALVRGAVALSLRIGVPALLVSLTVVAFGTSAPELLISVEAALDDAPGIAYGNVVGSNIANVLLVLGVPAIISTLDARDCDSQRTYVMMMIASVVFIFLQGLLLLALLVLVLSDAYIAARNHRRANGAGAEAEPIDDLPDEIAEADPSMARWKIGLLVGVGVLGLPFGAHLLIDGARGVALALGVSEAAIGLTLVAIGTSLPELATSRDAQAGGRGHGQRHRLQPLQHPRHHGRGEPVRPAGGAGGLPDLRPVGDARRLRADVPLRLPHRADQPDHGRRHAGDLCGVRGHGADRGRLNATTTGDHRTWAFRRARRWSPAPGGASAPPSRRISARRAGTWSCTASAPPTAPRPRRRRSAPPAAGRRCCAPTCWTTPRPRPSSPARRRRWAAP